MAYIQTPIEDDEEKKRLAQGSISQIAEQPGSPVSGGAIGSGEAPQGARPAGATRQFADVRSFLEANRPQAQALAQRIGGEIQKEAETVQKDIGTAGQQFQSEVEKGAIRTEPVRGLIQEATLNPQEVLKRQQDVERLKAVRGAQYQGPQALKGTQTYAGLESRVGEAQRKAGLTETQAGREELLGLAGRPSTGGLRLDQLLLSQTPEARAALQQAGASTAGLKGALEQTGTQAGEFAKQAAEETAATKSLFGEQFGKAKSEFQKQLQDRLSQVTGEAQRRAEAAKQTVAGTLDEQALADLGITKEEFQKLSQAQKDLLSDYAYKRDLGDYLSQEIPNYNVSQVATESDLARQQALEELAGQQFGILGPKVGGAKTDVSDFMAEAARAGTVGTLSGKDRSLIDRYFNREELTEPEWKVINKALKREAEYAKGKKFLPKDGVDLGDVLVDPVTGVSFEDIAKKLGPVQETAKNVEEFFTTPARQVRDEANRVIDSLKNAVGNTNAEKMKEALKVLDPREQIEAVKQIVKDPVQTVNKVVNNVSNSVKKAIKKLCFVAESFFVMADNLTRAVEDIQLGDNMKDGGVVYSVRRSYVDEDVHEYLGTKVTGSHAVFEDGKWIRVADSKHAIKLAHRGIVYSICNEKHRMVSNFGITFADEQETDDYEDLTIGQSLERLNNGKIPVEVN